MLDIATKLLLSKQLRFEKGRLVLLNHPITFSPISTFHGVQRILEKIGKENALYYGAKETGISWNEVMKSNYKIKNVNDILKWGQDVVTMAGWGVFLAEKTDLKNEEFRWVLLDSVLATEYKKSKYPVDNVVRGYFAGAATFILKKSADAVETKCKAIGSARCEFIIKPTEKFNMKNPIVKRQLKRP